MSAIKDYVITGLSYLTRSSKRKLIRFAFQLRGKIGIEVGGPSQQFSLMGTMPVYLFASQVDGVNFSTETVWEGSIHEGNNYRYYTKTGYQYIKEATDLSGIRSASYDFALSCHSLEHVANPIKAIREWRRVLKKDGLLFLYLPDKNFTFDQKRPYTTLQHIQDDFAHGTDEYDTTHIEEILHYHETNLETDPVTKAELEALLKDNYKNRRAHHHVFSQELVKTLLEENGWRVLYQQTEKPFHLITVAQKSGT